MSGSTPGTQEQGPLVEAGNQSTQPKIQRPDQSLPRELLPAETQRKQRGWEMTDPRHHDPHNFRYIIYGMRDRRTQFRADPNAFREDIIEEDIRHVLFKPNGEEILTSEN